MKKYFGILMILALLAAPAFANGPEDTGTVTVTVNVSQFAEINLPEGGISMNTADGERTDNAGHKSPQGRENSYFFTVLANFAYDMWLTSDKLFDDRYAAAVWDDNVAFWGTNGDKPAIAYMVRVNNAAGSNISSPMIPHNNPGDPNVGQVVTWDEITQNADGELGGTTTFRVATVITTLTSESDFGNPRPTSQSNYNPGVEAWLAGEYEGSLTLTIVPTGDPSPVQQ